MTADIVRPFAPVGDSRAPAGWAQRPEVRASRTDPALPHQINLFHAAGFDLCVGCNCGRRWGPFTSLDEAWALYNAHLPAEAVS